MDEAADAAANQQQQTYPSGYGARLLSECALHAQVRTLPSALLFPRLRVRHAKKGGFAQAQHHRYQKLHCGDQA